MRNIRQLLVAFLMSVVVACGGGGTLDSGGTPTTPVITLAATVEPSNVLTQTSNITVKVKVTSTTGVLSGKLVTFTLSDAGLATFSNQAGTALTDASGVASIQLFVGAKSGAGTVTATLDSGEKTSVGFTSEGKLDSADILTLSADLVAGNNGNANAPCGAREVSRVCQPQVKVKLVSAQGKSMQNRQLKLTIPATDVNKASFSGGAATITVSLDAAGQGAATLNVGTEANDGRVEVTVVDATGVSPVFTGFSSKGDYYSVTLLANKLQLGTGNVDFIELTTLVRNPGNVVVKGAKVEFSTESLSNTELQIDSDITAADGTAKAKLTSKSDFKRRTVKVQSSVGKQMSEALLIQIDGNKIEIQKPDSVVLESQSDVFLTLTDSAGNAIPNAAIAVESQLGNLFALSPASAASVFNSKFTGTTDVSGKLKLVVKAAKVGDDTITVSTLNSSTTSRLTVNGDAFAFTPASQTALEIDIAPAKADKKLDVLWSSNNTAVVGQNVRFISNRGVLLGAATATPQFTNPQPLIALTDANGVASAFAYSEFTGFASVEATAIRDGKSIATARRDIEFVSSDAQKIEVQVAPAQVAISERAAVRAIVRDSKNNPVKNKRVVFQLDKSSGGVINPVEAITNSQGVAVTEFIADQTTGANTGANLNIRAYVMDVPAVSNSTPVAVGNRTLSFRFGTGNAISKPNVSTYSKQFSVIVTDSSGNPVPNQALNVAVLPVAYNHGYWRKEPLVGTFVNWAPEVTKSCVSEDANNNGILDAGEDISGDGQLTPLNVAKVEKSVTSGPITSDLSGVATFNLVYPQDYGAWTTVRIIVSGFADGTENVSSRLFTLPVSAEDTGDEKVQPVANAFGFDGTCIEP
ncbi:hypothetical protein [Rheinheimera texasensis]|uniref:hypothetical protein n=1 Tax=Rheinheimera texasensis TaxID=306205 RepID=UPI0032B2A95E